MNNFDYQMFLNGTTNDGFNDIFLQGNTNSNNFPIFNNGVTNNLNNNLTNPNEGYIKGNMFKNLYLPFKNYSPAKLTARNAREEALINLGQMHFAMHEANLYLDNFPNDMNMINKFNEFRNSYEKLLNDYQAKYGPLEITSPYMTKTPFAWSNDKFPWDRRNS
ncbi:MAG: spore coat protein CotJB [Bacilli bacterium]|nr:spore coat protein CotJB [Bacilli bacterium]